MKGKFAENLRQYYRLVRAGQPGTTEAFLREHPDVAGFMNERAEAYLVANPSAPADMEEIVRNNSKLIQLSIPERAAHLIARASLSFAISIEEAAYRHVYLCSGNGVPEIASATMVNVSGFFGLKRDELLGGVRSYHAKTPFRAERIELTPFTAILSLRLSRDTCPEERREISHALYAMEDVL